MNRDKTSVVDMYWKCDQTDDRSNRERVRLRRRLLPDGFGCASNQIPTFSAIHSIPIIFLDKALPGICRPMAKRLRLPTPIKLLTATQRAR